MQNKANFRKSQMNVTDLLKRNYDKMDTWSIGKNKPNSNPIQSQSNPIYRGVAPGEAGLKPIKCQNKPNSNPIYRGVASGEAGTKPIWRQKMTVAAMNRKTWKIKAEYCTIAMQSLKTMNEEKHE